jgi:ABC-type proline/glycine betaine transport system substrate-binding protein
VFADSVNKVHCGVQVKTLDWDQGDTTIVDGRIEIAAKAWVGATVPQWPTALPDTLSARKVAGWGGATIDLKSTSLKANVSAAPIRFENIHVRKLDD